MLKAEICRAIAMKLGYEVRAETFVGNFRYCLFLKGERVDGSGWTEERIAWAQIDNFFTDESASARLLDAMPEPLLQKYPEAWWAKHQRDFDTSTYLKHEDRKTVIVLAAIKWLKIQEDCDGI